MEAGSPDTVRQTVRDLLENPERLESMRRRAAELAQPSASVDIARLMFDLADRDRPVVGAARPEALVGTEPQRSPIGIG